MTRTGKTRQRFARMALLILGLALGLGIGFVLYISIKRRQQNSTALTQGKALTRRPIHAITLPLPEETTGIQPARLPLKVAAIPASFVRREKGTIRVETMPGAQCEIEVVYSTNRRPTSLDTGLTTVDAQGAHEWAWQIGTGGAHVDVTVRAWSDGYEQASATLRVAVVD